MNMKQDRSVICIHGAKSTRVVYPRSAKHRATLVKETAQREGWAYATVRSGTGVRVVTDSTVGSVSIGDTHMDLDAYNPEPEPNQMYADEDMFPPGA